MKSFPKLGILLTTIGVIGLMLVVHFNTIMVNKTLKEIALNESYILTNIKNSNNNICQKSGIELFEKSFEKNISKIDKLSSKIINQNTIAYLNQVISILILGIGIFILARGETVYKGMSIKLERLKKQSTILDRKFREFNLSKTSFDSNRKVISILDRMFFCYLLTKGYDSFTEGHIRNSYNIRMLSNSLDELLKKNNVDLSSFEKETFDDTITEIKDYFKKFEDTYYSEIYKSLSNIRTFK